MLENNTNAVTVIYSGGDIQVPFLFYDADDLVVLYEITPKILGTDYTVTGAGSEAGGKVTLVSPPANGTRVSVIRKVEFTQLLQIPANGIIPEGALNRALDRIVMMIQQLAEQAERAVTYPEGTEKGEVANAGEMLDSIEKARTDINNAVNVAEDTLATANQKLTQIQEESAAKLLEMQSEVDKAVAQMELAKKEADRAKSEADRAQTCPVGMEISGEWKRAPYGCLAYFGTTHQKKAFPALWQHAQDQGLVISEAAWQAEKAAKGACGKYADVDATTFRIPLQKYASTPVIEGIAGKQVGDVALDAVPEIEGKIQHHPYFKVEGSFYEDEEIPDALMGSSYAPNARIGFKASLSSPVYGRDNTDRVEIRRVHKLYCVKAYDVVTTPAQADMAAMVGDIQKNGVEIQKVQEYIQKKGGYLNFKDVITLSYTLNLVQQAPKDGFLYGRSVNNSVIFVAACNSKGEVFDDHENTLGMAHTGSGYNSLFIVPIQKGDYFKIVVLSGEVVFRFIGAK